MARSTLIASPGAPISGPPAPQPAIYAVAVGGRCPGGRRRAGRDGQTVIAPVFSGAYLVQFSCTNMPSSVGHFWDTSSAKTRRSPRTGEQCRAAKSL